MKTRAGLRLCLAARGNLCYNKIVVRYVALSVLLMVVAALLLCVTILLFILFRRYRNERKQLEKQDRLMRAINDAGALLLQSEAGDNYDAIIQSMKMICACVEVDMEKELPPNPDEDTKEKEQETPKTGLLRELEALGINAAPALTRFDNDEESYLRILSSFVTHAPANIEIAKFSIQDLNAYRIAVHSLKGSGRGIGGEKIGDMAEKLENAARQGDTAYIELHNGPFIEAAEKFIASVSAFLQTLPDKEDSAKPEKDAPDPKLLAAVKQAAENYDMAALQEAIKSLDVWRYRSQPDLVKSLREKAGKSDFEAILNLISAWTL